MLNVKQEAFCLHYAKTGNATESYKKAGYSAKTATAIYSNANRLLKNEQVQARLQELAAEIASDKIASVKEIHEYLTSVIRGETTEDVVVVESHGNGFSKSTIKQVRTANKDRIKAAETLGKMQGAFDTKSNINIVIPVFGDEERLED